GTSGPPTLDSSARYPLFTHLDQNGKKSAVTNLCRFRLSRADLVSSRTGLHRLRQAFQAYDGSSILLARSFSLRLLLCLWPLLFFFFLNSKPTAQLSCFCVPRQPGAVHERPVKVGRNWADSHHLLELDKPKSRRSVPAGSPG